MGVRFGGARRTVISDTEQTYVLVHGFLGFDEIGIPGVPIRYFRKVPEALAGLGVHCLIADNLPASGPVAARAKALQTFLAKHGVKRCVLIAHSMGGLDSRYLIERLDGEHRVRCLVTIGTPHRGTPLANWALHGRGPLASLLRAIGREGLQELTPEACTRRNEALQNRSDVRYLSVAGARSADVQIGLFRNFISNVMDDEEPHDGLVSVASAKWGEFIRTVPADHFELVGWDLALTKLPALRFLWGARRKTFDHLALYRRLVKITATPGEYSGEY